jgi:hypothetical protein
MSEAMVSIYVLGGSISVPADAAARLEEWANWSRDKPSQGRCASAEGRYDSEYPDASRAGVAGKTDLKRILAVEKIIGTRLPRIRREIIKRHFVYREEPRAVSRALCIHRSKYGCELRRSVLMVKNNLTQF